MIFLFKFYMIGLQLFKVWFCFLIHINSLFWSINFLKLRFWMVIKINGLIWSSLNSVLRAAIQCCCCILCWKIWCLPVLRMRLKRFLIIQIRVIYFINVLLIVICFKFTLTQLFFKVIHYALGLLILKRIRNWFFLFWGSIFIEMYLFIVNQILRALFQLYWIFIILIHIYILNDFSILLQSYLSIIIRLSIWLLWIFNLFFNGFFIILIILINCSHTGF